MVTTPSRISDDAYPHEMSCHVSGGQRQAVADHDCDQPVGGNKEHLVQLRRLAVGRRVHEHHQQHANAKINRDQAGDPGAFTFLHFEEKQQRHQRNEHQNPIELGGNIADQNAELHDETTRIMDQVRRTGFLILPPA